jgi:PAS domain-containing protein
MGRSGQTINEGIDALEESERVVRGRDALKGAIMETAIDCIIVMDHEGKILEFNRAAEVLSDKIMSVARGAGFAEELERYLEIGASNLR